MKIRAIRLLSVMSVLTLLLATNLTASAQSIQSAPLEEALNPDGTLRRGVAGSFDASAYQMKTNQNGEPVFVPIAQASPNSWDSDFATSYNGMNATVRAIATDGSGAWYFGGSFSQAGALPVNRIVRYNETLNAFSPLGVGANNGVNGDVGDIKLMGGFVYVGGSFTSAGGVTANNIARYDPITNSWSAVGSGGGNGVNGEVLTMSVVGGSTLYVGGNFTRANVGTSEIVANNVARWNGTAWSSVGTGANNGVNGTVSTVVGTTNNVFVGGTFISAGTTSNQFIARYDLISNTWNGFGAGTDAQVTAIAVSGSTVYASGFFTTAGGNPANRIARWDGASWNAMGSGLNQPAGSIVVSGSNVFVGGNFTTAGGNPANRVARWNGTSWSALGAGVDNNVGEILLFGSSLYVGGVFTTAGGNPANRIAVFNTSASTWSPLTFQNGANAAVRAISILGDNVYVGGDFTIVGGVEANHIARYNAVSKTWSPLGSGVNAPVFAIATFSLLGDAVYVGGSFTQAGGLTANRIARWFNDAWTTAGTGGGNGVDGSVNALAYASNILYVGGNFTQANVGSSPVTANRVARLNTVTNAWSAMGSGGNGVNGVVNALWISETGRVFVGGNFTQANVGTSPIAANRIATFDPGSGNWSALGTGTTGEVLAIAGSGSDVFVGGSFTSAGGVAVTSYCARWNGSRWLSMNQKPNNTVNALAVSGRYVFAGGTFTSAGGNPATNLARWDGSNWTSVGTGTGEGADAIINAMAVRAGRQIFLGGDFLNVNAGSPIQSRRIGRWESDTTGRVSSANLTFRYNVSTPGVPTISFTNSAPPPSSIPTGISTVSQYFWTLTPNTLAFAQGALEVDIDAIAGVTGNPAALRFLWRPNASTAWTNLGGTRLQGNVLISNAPLTAGGQIAIGDAGGGNQLPVELIRFIGGLHREGVLLQWSTASELNNSGFEIERKSQGANWNTLGFVRGNGTTTETQSYSFLDRTAVGKVQYRLKQIDFDGQFEYSNVIEVDAGLPKQFLLEQNYPNPFNPTTTIQYQLPVASNVSLKVYDALGKEVMTLANGRQEAGAYSVNVNGANLASGIYFYRLRAGNFVQTKKMMLVK